MNGEDKVVLNHEVPLLAMKRYHYFLNKQTEQTKKRSLILPTPPRPPHPPPPPGPII